LFSYRDYNRAIETPEFIGQIENFIKALREKGKKAAAYEYDKIKNELKNFEGLIDDIDKKTRYERTYYRLRKVDR
jgi:uncharacterized protein Yka (UPF0111/DUF47 family)